MRSKLIDLDFWPAYCGRIFPDMNYTKPLVNQTLAQYGGNQNVGSNIFFVNGGEDPWQWAGITTSNSALNQVARIADCDDCGHCFDLHTPSNSDP